MQQSLISVLDETKVKNAEEFSYYEFEGAVREKMQGYIIQVFDLDDFTASELAIAVADFIADYAKNNIVDNIQTESFWTEDEDACFVVVAIKLKGEQNGTEI